MSATTAIDRSGLRSAGGVLITPLGGWPEKPQPEPACLRSAGGVPIAPFSGRKEEAPVEAKSVQAPAAQRKGFFARLIDKLLGRG